MNKIIFEIKSTEYSPSIIFYSDNKLTIKGESRVENPKEFYNQLYTDLDKGINISHIQRLEFYFEYVSSSSILSLIGLMKKIIGEHEIQVLWLYDKEDEDIQELGEIIKETHYIPLLLKGV